VPTGSAEVELTIGQLNSRLVMGENPGIDLAPFSVARF
jgi:hypothetical protein